MFYCRKCADKKGWPITITGSYGPCELCGTVENCNDMPSKYLFLPKDKK